MRMTKRGESVDCRTCVYVCASALIATRFEMARAESADALTKVMEEARRARDAAYKKMSNKCEHSLNHADLAELQALSDLRAPGLGTPLVFEQAQLDAIVAKKSNRSAKSLLEALVRSWCDVLSKKEFQFRARRARLGCHRRTDGVGLSMGCSALFMHGLKEL